MRVDNVHHTESPAGGSLESEGPTRALFFQVRRYTMHGYAQVEAEITSGRRVPLRWAISQCDAGRRYCEAETNSEFAALFRILVGSGHSDVFESYHDDTRAILRWQVFPHGGYCRPVFEYLGSSFTTISSAMALLKRIARRVETARVRAHRAKGRDYGRRDVGPWSFECADAFAAALRAAGAVEVCERDLAEHRSFLVAREGE